MIKSGDWLHQVKYNLECDLHFTDGTTKYIVDFKSGFGSNEKGNTNRLLLVGSIYQNIETENYKCLIFVRSTENNHYLTTLQKLWSMGDFLWFRHILKDSSIYRLQYS